jgi:multiple antibiotic resistance protein
MFIPFKPFIATLIPIFVAVDAIGNIPVFVSLVEGKSKKQIHKIIIDSVSTATVMAVAFVFVGKWVLRLLNVTIADFQIAGGVLLFVIAVKFLYPEGHKRVLSSPSDKDIGVFPLGTPLITGPAVLTTTLMMRDSFGLVATFVSLLINMLLVWIALARAEDIMKLIGDSGTRAFSKIMYILLGAIAVMMIRKGIMGVLVP